MKSFASVRTIDEYESQPKSSRYFGLWYLRPLAMEWDEWEKFDNLMKRRHPVQFKLREFGTWISFRADDATKFFPSLFRYLFRPCHPIIRKSIPRTWCDLDALMVDINFAIILQFHDEMKGSCVNWDWDEPHRTFKTWIESAVKWINETRPNLIKQDDDGVPDKVSMSSINTPEFQAWSELMPPLPSSAAFPSTRRYRSNPPERLASS